MCQTFFSNFTNHAQRVADCHMRRISRLRPTVFGPQGIQAVYPVEKRQVKGGRPEGKRVRATLMAMAFAKDRC